MNLLKQGMGTALSKFLKATIVGGLLFLLPLALVLIVLRRALQAPERWRNRFRLSCRTPWLVP